MATYQANYRSTFSGTIVPGATNDRVAIFQPRLTSPYSPTVFMCHGGGGNATFAWADPSLTLLAGTLAGEGCTVLVPDIGDYTITASPLSGPDNWGNPQATLRLEQYRGVLAAYGALNDRMCMMGFSMGGATSIRYAIDYPDHIRGIVHWSPAVDFQWYRDHRNDPGNTCGNTSTTSQPSIATLANGIDKAYGLLPTDPLPNLAIPWTQPRLQGLPYLAYYNTEPWTKTPQVGAACTPAGCASPCYIMDHPSRDDLIPYAGVERLAAWIGSSATLHPVNGVGHFTFVDIPNALDTVVSFVLTHAG